MDKADMAELGCRSDECEFALQMREMVKGHVRNGWVAGSASVPANSVKLLYPIGIALNSAKKGEVVRVQMFGSVSEWPDIDCAKTIGAKGL